MLEETETRCICAHVSFSYGSDMPVELGMLELQYLFMVLPHTFTRHWRFNHSNTRTQAGTGLLFAHIDAPVPQNPRALELEPPRIRSP